ncbi:MAG: right-handed parallel beta-helix repeat-containing protein [Ruminococcaceae bacterium]|nr:right-handed parallel beta-helix repeat-containing protein [Oscillospiraceae bacterium]
MNTKSMIKIEYSNKVAEFDNMGLARAEVRKILASEKKPEKIVVTVPAGVYSPNDFVFGAEDCSEDTRVIYRADGEAVITAGISVKKSEWKEPDEKIAARFSKKALPHIKMISLSDCGLTQDDWGAKESPIGGAHSGARYDDAVVGCSNSFFTGDKRMIKARFPNKEYDLLEEIVDQGDTDPNTRNPNGGAYRISRRTAERIKKWAEPNKAWIYGYFAHDWADSSSPIDVNIKERLIYPEYVESMGARIDKYFTAFFHFYNVPEELDMEGEWYLDRETGNIYFWAYEGAESADYSYKNDVLISCTNTCNLVFEGFTLLGTETNAIELKNCDDMVLNDLLIKNIGGWAVRANGNRILVSNNEVMHTGMGGIYTSGGDRNTLVHSDNRVTNNYIHHFAEVFTTYQQAIFISGCGNTADHNEICYAPHAGLSVCGDENLVEYNLLHHVVMQSNDAGNIYQGGDWMSRGTIIRYNMIRDSGSDEWKSTGLYFDDGMSGQTAYGNIIINVTGCGITAGGGREHTIMHNLIVNCGVGIGYDSRFHDGFVGRNKFWARVVSHTGPGSAWSNFNHVKGFREGMLAEKYPLRAKMLDFGCDPYSRDCPCSPAYSKVIGNAVIRATGIAPHVAPDKDIIADHAVYVYSDVKDNEYYKTFEEAGWDPEKMILSDDSPVYKDIPGFERIPIEEIGILNKKNIKKQGDKQLCVQQKINL